MKKYMTTQRRLLLSFLEEHPHQQYSVEELAEQLCHHQNISISSIYRNISQMAAEGLVQRFAVDHSRQFLYQYLGGGDCDSHIHLKCQHCGQIFHVDDALLAELLAALSGNFEVDLRKTIVYGSCKNCS